MRRNATTALSFLLILATGGMVSCSGAQNAVVAPVAAQTRSAGEITRDVQSKIKTDSSLANRKIGIEVYEGVVILTGTVESSLERGKAEVDAAGISGVKGILNRIVVVSPDAAQGSMNQSAGPPTRE